MNADANQATWTKVLGRLTSLEERMKTLEEKCKCSENCKCSSTSESVNA